MILRNLICLCTVLAWSGCAGQTAHKPGRYVVQARTTPFYKYGPAQSFGPDFVLNRGQGMTLLEQSFGYSRVQTEDGFTGYVPAEDISPAPALPAAAALPVAKSKQKRGKEGDGYYTGPVRKSVPIEKVEGAPALFDVFDGPLPSDVGKPEPKTEPKPETKPEPKPDAKPAADAAPPAAPATSPESETD